MRPPFVQSGDTIALICTARWLTTEQCADAVAVFASHDLRLVIAPHATVRHFQLAGTTQQRTQDLQWALSDPDIKAVIIGRGGYGTVQLIDELDMQTIVAQPKWVVGFSDATSLLAHFNSHGISAIHATMPVQFPTVSEASLSSMFAALKGTNGHVQWKGHAEGFWPWNECYALWGGNLSVICSLLDSPSWQPQGSYFLVIEDLDEMLYHLDRMLYAVGRSNATKGLKGVLVGGMSDFKDNTIAHGFGVDNPWGTEALDIVSQWSAHFDIPIISGMPVGHQAENRALYLGEKAAVQMLSHDLFELTWPDVPTEKE